MASNERPQWNLKITSTSITISAVDQNKKGKPMLALTRIGELLGIPFDHQLATWVAVDALLGHLTVENLRG
jgi:hypothetical protein